MTTQSEAERVSALREKRFEELRSSPEALALEKSGQLQVALDLLGKRQRPARFKWDPPASPLDLWVIQAVRGCLAEPDLAEKMTAKERREKAIEIKRHAEALWEAIAPFMRAGEAGFGWPFQPELDGLALDLSVDYTKDFDYPPDELDDAQHRSRYAIYYVLMNRMEDVLATLVSSGDWFADTKTIIKKPNDPNARRLYFLRVMTERLVSEFRSPCRGVALALASPFFDCSDLDEAAVSKLAPVRQREPVSIPVERLEEMAAWAEERLSKITDPDQVEEYTYYLNFYRDLIQKSSG